ARAARLSADPHHGYGAAGVPVLVRRALRRRACVAALSAALAWPLAGLADDPTLATIARLKASIVAVGSFERTRNPAFEFSGTGFAIGDGLRIATNEHVLPKVLNIERNETFAIAARTAEGSIEVRPARRVAADSSHDLVILEIKGAPLPALRLGDSDRVKEGEVYLFTGFPIGAILGLYPVTHRAMIAAI